ncbi:MAG: hypothetical protein MUF15_20225 [Acidobacteria bacterium]|jgi:hypothetical protein|nr:hypothetical protein [Acidobacteriota bacterium]
MKRDFTFTMFEHLLAALRVNRYEAQPFGDFIESPGARVVILRHDVDRRPENALVTAQIENQLGIRASYYFRIVDESYDEAVIKEIAAMGHEIGYHYEDLALAGGAVQKAFHTFQKNLQNFRKVYPVKTVCMHGSPLSKWDNRKMWEAYDYKSCGITGEPYYDLDFNQVLYLTDTGRKWNGTGMNVRDRVESGFVLEPRVKTTPDLITCLENDRLPDHIMLNVHPERWENDFLPWTGQLLFQNIKNVFKRVIVLRNERISNCL